MQRSGLLMFGRPTAILCLCFFAVGCAYKTQFSLVDPPVNTAVGELPAEIAISEIRMGGSLKTSKPIDQIAHFSTGFASTSSGMRGTRDASIADAVLKVSIQGKPSVKAQFYPSFIPLVSLLYSYGYTFGADALAYNWKVDVQIELDDPQGQTISRSEFQVEGEDGQQPNFAGQFVSLFLGTGVYRAAYPLDGRKKDINKTILQLVGAEVGRRLSQAPYAEFLTNRVAERGDMSPAEYTRLLAQRTRMDTQRDERIGLTSSMEGGSDLLATDSTSPGRLVVFGVGVDKYESDRFSDLRFAASDCERVVDWFREKHGLTGDFASCLTDEDATAIKINRYLKRGAALLLRPEDTFVFYFSGHGAADLATRSSDKGALEMYLLVADSEPDAIPLTAVNLSQLFEQIDRLPARKKIILIDSCFAGEAGREVLGGVETTKLRKYGYGESISMAGEGTVVIAASAEDQVSLELDSFSSGLFTYYLLEGLSGQADSNSNAKVDLTELYGYVSERVSSFTDGSQTPVLRGEIGSSIEF